MGFNMAASRAVDRSVPLGGYEQSGSGRRARDISDFDEVLEVTAVPGYRSA
jgi:hypothetical protein